MKVWAIIRLRQKIRQDLVMEFPGGYPDSDEGWYAIVAELCQGLRLGRPVFLQKHSRQLAQFGRTAFLPADFLETVEFDKLEIEVIPEKKDGR